MGKHSNTLKTLRAIALEHATMEQPDLASMARELGRVVHQDASALASRLAGLRTRQRGFERWLLAERSKPPIRVLVLAWPPNHLAPVHDHAGMWGLDMTLVGALEVQSYTRDADSDELLAQGRDWLGPGDGSWFEDNHQRAHRCRNLSRHDTALTLHVYGGDLAGCFANEQAGASVRRMAQAQRSLATGRLPA